MLNRVLAVCFVSASLALAGCGEKCPHVCYCCHSVSTSNGESSCADTSYKVLIPASSTGPICTSCKSSCEREAPGTTAIACRDYGSSGENAGCTVDQ